MAGGIQAWVTDDPERDWPRVRDHLAYQQDSYRRHMVEGTDQPVPPPIDPEKLIRREPRGPLGYFWFGTPEDIAQRIRAYIGDAPVETVFLWASVGGMAEDLVAEHVTTVCTRLAPLLRRFRPDGRAPDMAERLGRPDGRCHRFGIRHRPGDGSQARGGGRARRRERHRSRAGRGNGRRSSRTPAAAPGRMPAT